MKAPLLSVNGLTIEFRSRAGTVHALEGVSLRVDRGTTAGIVGESGSGKSVLAYSIIGLLDRAGRVTSGTIVFDDRDILTMNQAERDSIRGRDISMIFQNPSSALNPIRTIGQQIEDVIVCHRVQSSRTAYDTAIEMLARVRIPDPTRRHRAYPFELSGGMCQRVMIATALSCSPQLLIADEPTTGLDVTTQAAIMDLIREQTTSRQMATILITHDLGLAAEYCDQIVVIHAGQVVESGPTKSLFQHPAHPYTAKLVTATPTLGTRLEDLTSIEGGLPDLRRELPYCRFSGRCSRFEKACNEAPLPRIRIAEDHFAVCRRPV
jgi:peptide/nickel transport system ATP-binding protein